MWRRVHPAVLNGGRNEVGAREVFGDGAEANSGGAGAADEVRFPAVLVFELAGLFEEAEGMDAGGAGEGWIPAERGEAMLGAIGVGAEVKGAFGGGDARARGLRQGGRNTQTAE